MLLWKFYRMAWTVHANTDAPATSSVIDPTRITSLHTRQIGLTPATAQALEREKDLTVDNIADTVDCHIVEKWKRRGVCP